LLPEDPDWHEDSGNETITHDFVNALELSVDYRASAVSDGVFPSPTGTTLPWGGGRIIFFMDDDGIAEDVSVIVDSSMDWRHRMITILDAHLYGAANELPGGGAEPADQRSGQHYGQSGYTHEGSADGSPPATNHIDTVTGAGVVSGEFYVDNATFALKFHNEVAAVVFPMFIILVSDQIPTRLP
jgi:hypothetical protein